MNAPAPDGAVLFLLCCGIAAGAIADWRARRIPNSLVAGIAAAGLVHATALGGPGAALASLLGTGTGVALLAWPFARGLMGGGDVKLLGAIGSWVGVAGSVHVALVGTLLGGPLALMCLLRRTPAQRAEVRRNVGRFVRAGVLAVPAPENLERARGIPYGLALATAALWVLLTGAR